MEIKFQGEEITRRKNKLKKKAAQSKNLQLRIIRNKGKHKDIHAGLRYGNYDIQNKNINLLSSFE